MNRRGFLARLLRGAALATGGGSALRAAADGLAAGVGGESGRVFSPLQWETLAAVQEHMLPSEPGRPGAREVNAIGYLRLVLNQPGIEARDLDLLLEGVVALDSLSQGRFAKRFAALTDSEREGILRDFEKSGRGAHWLGEMLDFLLEALLGDPVYGGNPNGIGWAWLEITPGFPRPPAKAQGASE